MEQLREAQGQGLMVFEEGGPSSADQSYQQVRQSCLPGIHESCCVVTRHGCLLEPASTGFCRALAVGTYPRSNFIWL